MHNALFLIAAIACEVTATTALNYTHQFTRLPGLPHLNFLGGCVK